MWEFITYASLSHPVVRRPTHDLWVQIGGRFECVVCTKKHAPYGWDRSLIAKPVLLGVLT